MNNIDFLVESLLKTDAFKLDSQFGYSMRPRKLSEVEFAELHKSRLDVIKEMFMVSNDHHGLAISIYNSIQDVNQKKWFFDTLSKGSKLSSDFLPREALQGIDDACLSLRLGQDVSKPDIQIKFEELNNDDRDLANHFDMNREFINQNVMESIVNEFEVANLVGNQKRIELLLSMTRSESSQQLFSKIIAFKESTETPSEEIVSWASRFELERLPIVDVPKTIDSQNLEEGALLPKDFHIRQSSTIDTSKRMSELYDEHQFRTVITSRNVFSVAAQEVKDSFKSKLSSLFSRKGNTDNADEDWDLENVEFSDKNPNQIDELNHDTIKSIEFLGNDGSSLFETKIDYNKSASVHLSKGSECNEVVAEMMVLQYIKVNGVSPMDVNPPKNQNKNGAKMFIENVVMAALEAGLNPNDITITPTEHFNGEELSVLKNQIEAKFNKLNFDDGGIKLSSESSNKVEEVSKNTKTQKLDDTPEATKPEGRNPTSPLVKFGKAM
ncbi:hypothetical protein [Vibrio alginolyticus]|uniref:hypothetical protein n=1 Tax=Vibrio alginolyticus TaxID=663 RepID=UPI0006CA69F3|nr:hypothetical protein [Vibrio alginolyticus]KPM98532.1 hypothetical protein AOG25_08815 [Vibrio alginolyticus]CAH7149982.1 conserved hypothetical protein [Vibrio chagasii]